MSPEAERMVRVLVVDDSVTYRRILEKIVQKRPNLEIHVAKDGQEAINHYSAFPAELLLTDIEMPNVDGIELTRYLKSINPNIKVIVLSSLGFESKVKEAIAAGAHGFVVKPYDETKVLTIVDRILKTMR